MKRILLLVQMVLLLGLPKTILGLNQLPDVNRKACWTYITDTFIDDQGQVTRYEDPIKVCLRKGFTKSDSIFVADVVDQLGPILENVSIAIVPANGNLELSLRYVEEKSYATDKNYTFGPAKKMDYQHLKMVIYKEGSEQYKKNAIRYHLVQALIQEKSDKEFSFENSEKSIFSKAFPQTSRFTAEDQYILANIYARDFQKCLKANYPGGILRYWLFKYGDVYKSTVRMVYASICILLLLFYMRIGAFEKDSRKYLIFIFQGFQFLLFIVIIQMSELYLAEEEIFRQHSIWSAIKNLLIMTILVGHLIYLLEWKVLGRLQSAFLRPVMVFISTILSLFLCNWGYNMQFSNNFFSLDLKYILIIVVFVVSFGLIRALIVYINMRNRQIILKKDLYLSNLEKLKQQAELQALHSRINPHFLYNSLNSIASLAHEDANKTEQMALALSDFCRSAINKQNKDSATIAEEVALIRNYLEIEKVRFGDRLNYKMDIEASLENHDIPRFLLQPLVENAIKHGVGQITNQGFIRVEVSLVDDRIEMKVYDNGPEFPDELITGYGLQSLHDKLQIIYKDAAHLNWQNSPEKCICVTLPFKPQFASYE